jgi:hypothetical protein
MMNTDPVAKLHEEYSAKHPVLALPKANLGGGK